MEVQFGPNSVDEPNLLYKLQKKIKVFNTSNTLPNRGYNLVASSSKYGIVFVGGPDGTLSAYYLSQLVDKDSEPQNFTVPLSEKPTHIAVSCDHELLAVTGGQLMCVYKVADFQNQNIQPSVSIKLDVSPQTFVSALQWNPCIPDTIAIAFFDGTLLVCQVATLQVKKVQSRARCICWSPKGKQLVTGNSDGTLCQFKPDLTPAKTVVAPNIFSGAPVECLAIHWISTFQFAVVYKNAAENSRPAVTIVNTPKAGQPSCINYEDICYSMGSNRPWFYYLHGLAQWNMILCSSSNSMELATLGSSDGANWLQWCQADEARPELPLTNKKQENYPVGICIDTCAVHQLTWGENEVLPHMPLLLVVSQSGLLTIFNIVNLNKQAGQLCTPPQQIALPAAAMTSGIPGVDVPQPEQPAPTASVPAAPAPAPTAPAPAQPKPQAPPAQVQQPSPQQVKPPPYSAMSSQFTSIPPQASVKPVSFAQQSALAFSSAPILEPKQETKPTPTLQPGATPTKAPASASAPKPQATEVNAALKAEQERVSKLKADQELRSMLVKEVNDFQMELYKFVVKTKEVQIKLQRDLDSINSNFNYQSLDPEQLRKDCSMDDLRAGIVELKLELVRACAVVAEARTHAEAKDLHQWTQADPLTTKRVASVKKLAYYVESQLEQAQKVLDFQWNEMIDRDPQFNKPGQRMIRPILDDVYQPLVKQQEILSRQQAVLRTLKHTLKECDSGPMFKSTSLLRSTPFKKDPLSKLTKNILNMSIEPQTKERAPLLTAQKLDALRDLLSNHRPTKIKPVNVSLRQHLTTIRQNYDRSVKEKVVKNEPLPLVKTEPAMSYHVKTEPAMPYYVKTEPLQRPQPMKYEFSSAVPTLSSEAPKPDLIAKPLPVPSFAPVNTPKHSMPAGVARSLFTDEPKQEPPRPQIQPSIQPQPKPQLSFGFSAPNNTTVTANTRSVLKDMLQNKLASVDAKNDANTFMGQKICTPSAFSLATTTATPTPSFTSKPIADINNMFNKFTPQAFTADPKVLPQTTTKPKSDETGEAESVGPRVVASKPKEQKPMTNLFGMATSTQVATSQNVPDVLKSNAQPLAAVTENKPVSKIDKAIENLKENVPETSSETVPLGSQKTVKEQDKENAPKSLSASNSKSSIFDSAAEPTTHENETSETKKVETKASLKLDTTKAIDKSELSTNASSLFAAANAATPTETKSSPFGSPSPAASPTSIFGSEAKPSSPDTTSTKSSASLLFGTAAASQPVLEQTTQSGSIFTSTPPASASVFAQGSIFGSTSPTKATTTESTSPVFGTSTTTAKPSVFSSPTPASPSSVFGAAVSSPQSAFASTAAFTTAQSSAFASPSSVFSSAAASAFGTATTTAAQSLFGPTTTTTTQSVFGTTTPTTQSGFGGTTPTTQASIFGSPTAQSSVFGSPTPSTQASVFGTSSQPSQTSVFGASTQSSQPSAFGTPTQSTQASVFGTPTQSTQASVFGSPTQPTQSSVFGVQPATTTSGSLFGGAESNLFASASISTTTASSPGGGSIFGGSSPGSVFGSGSSTNVFGGKTTFGQSNPTAASIFGGASSFGQKPANIWPSGNNSAGGGFGSSAFGQQSTTQASSIFGGSTGGSFSQPSTGQPFGSPQQSSVFGTTQQQAAPGFGGSPAFGNKTGFGQSASFGTGASFGSFGGFNKSPTSGFGAPPSFGGGSAFGGSAFGSTSPGKVFGGAPASPGFGSPTQSNATFESLAQQDTLTFGNLAQQSAPVQPKAPSFNTSPSFTGWRG